MALSELQDVKESLEKEYDWATQILELARLPSSWSNLPKSNCNIHLHFCSNSSISRHLYKTNDILRVWAALQCIVEAKFGCLQISRCNGKQICPVTPELRSVCVALHDIVWQVNNPVPHFVLWLQCAQCVAAPLPSLSLLLFFSCPEQLNRWPCH